MGRGVFARGRPPSPGRATARGRVPLNRVLSAGHRLKPDYVQAHTNLGNVLKAWVVSATLSHHMSKWLP